MQKAPTQPAPNSFQPPARPGRQGKSDDGERATRPNEDWTRSRSSVPPIVDEVLRSPGQPLAPAARALMEPRFGHDFGRIRVHSDAKAAASAEAVDALAYTVGRDLVFGPGQYAPGTDAGQRLLAHELTHAKQQSAVADSAPPELAVGMAHDPPEQEADGVATSAGTNPPRKYSNVERPRLQRQPKEKAPARGDKKKPEVKITPSSRTIPKSEIDKPAPVEPAAGVSEKSAPEATAPAPKAEEGPKVEATVQGSAAGKTITTNLEVAIPIKEVGSVVVFGQPLVIGKELKAGVELGAAPDPTGLGPPLQTAAIKVSLKALSYELESLKFAGLKDLGLGLTGEAGIDPGDPFARPQLGVKGGLEASYQIPRTPIYLQGNIGYQVTLPATGPATAAPAADFGFKVELP